MTNLLLIIQDPIYWIVFALCLCGWPLFMIGIRDLTERAITIKVYDFVVGAVIGFYPVLNILGAIVVWGGLVFLYFCKILAILLISYLEYLDARKPNPNSKWERFKTFLSKPVITFKGPQ